MKKQKQAKKATVSREALRKVHQYLLAEGEQTLRVAPFIQTSLVYLEVGDDGEIKRRSLFNGSLDPYFTDPAAYKVYLDHISNVLEPGSSERAAFAAQMGYEPQVIVELATPLNPVIKLNLLTGRPEPATEKCFLINLHVAEGVVSVSHVVSEGPPRTCYQGVLPDEKTLPLEKRNSNIEPPFSRPMPNSQLH